MAMPQPEQQPFGMTLEEAMRTQRAIRRLKPDPVDDALIRREQKDHPPADTLSVAQSLPALTPWR